MPLKNSSTAYGQAAKTLHWLMAFILIGLIVLGLYMADQPRGEEKNILIRLHASIGLLAIALTTLRLVWRLANPQPASLNGSRWKLILEKLVHTGLYAIVFWQVITGSMTLMTVGWDVPFFDLFSIATPFERNMEQHHFWEDLHVTGWYVFAALLALHASAIVLHSFRHGASFLRRML